MAQHNRHKLLARIMKRYFSAVAHRLWHAALLSCESAAALQEQLRLVTAAQPPHFDCQRSKRKRDWRAK
jgi:hypothetical protein